MAQFNIKLTKSLIGAKKDQIATADKIRKISHLIEVTEA